VWLDYNRLPAGTHFSIIYTRATTKYPLAILNSVHKTLHTCSQFRDVNLGSQMNRSKERVPCSVCQYVNLFVDTKMSILGMLAAFFATVYKLQSRNTRASVV